MVLALSGCASFSVSGGGTGRFLSMKTVAITSVDTGRCRGGEKRARAGLEGGFLTEGFQIGERSQLDGVLREQRLGVSGAVEQRDAAKVGAILGVQGLVSLEAVDGTCRNWRMKIVDVETGSVASHSTAKGLSPYESEQVARWLRELKSRAR
jgi:hypothetical protein